MADTLNISEGTKTELARLEASITTELLANRENIDGIKKRLGDLPGILSTMEDKIIEQLDDTSRKILNAMQHGFEGWKLQAEELHRTNASQFQAVMEKVKEVDLLLSNHVEEIQTSINEKGNPDFSQLRESLRERNQQLLDKFDTIQTSLNGRGVEGAQVRDPKMAEMQDLLQALERKMGESAEAKKETFETLQEVQNALNILRGQVKTLKCDMGSLQSVVKQLDLQTLKEDLTKEHRAQAGRLKESLCDQLYDLHFTKEATCDQEKRVQDTLIEMKDLFRSQQTQIMNIQTQMGSYFENVRTTTRPHATGVPDVSDIHDTMMHLIEKLDGVHKTLQESTAETATMVIIHLPFPPK
jgi:conjugal transfer/entry exclusion protein